LASASASALSRSALPCCSSILSSCFICPSASLHCQHVI
jgi:hypothetical protein